MPLRPGQVPVGAVDHVDRRAHPPGEREQETPAARLIVAMCVAGVVRLLAFPSVVTNPPPSPLGSTPCPPVVQVHVAASERREEEGSVEARRELVESVEGTLTQRDAPAFDIALVHHFCRCLQPYRGLDGDACPPAGRRAARHPWRAHPGTPVAARPRAWRARDAGLGMGNVILAPLTHPRARSRK